MWHARLSGLLAGTFTQLPTMERNAHETFDIDKVNHLVAALADINGLIGTAEAAEPAAFQLLIEAPGDASFKMSAEGASTSHSRGTEVSADFLGSLKELAVAELHARREIVLQDLGALGSIPPRGKRKAPAPNARQGGDTGHDRRYQETAPHRACH